MCTWWTVLGLLRGFLSDVEESLYNNLVTSAPKVIGLEKKPEENNPAPQFIDNDIVPVKDNGKGRKVVLHASSQVSTRSYTKVFIQCIVAPSTMVVGSPTAIFSAPPPDLVDTPSYSGATFPSVSRKRKAVAPKLLQFRRRGHLVFH